MSNNPFENNPKYTQIFRILSPAERCDSREVIELYKKKSVDFAPYCLLRYRQVESQYPIKIIHKFSDLIAVELLQEGNNTVLYINTIYGQNPTNIVGNRFNVCCGTKSYVLNVEQYLYATFFNS